MKILAAVDGSTPSLRAATLGLRLAGTWARA
jgi:nucleotide-binding universal stress UspA family protein